MTDHDAWLIAAPEYNSSITGVLKNTIDWVSRSDDDDTAPLMAFKGKVVSLMSASPGALGGLRGLVHVRSILGNLGCIVLPGQVAVMHAQKAFADGALVDERQQARVVALGRALTETASRLAHRGH
jgi:NAD(P)H-dependent FMN reductase